MILKDDVNTYNSLYHLSMRWARADSTNFTFEDFIQSLNMAVNKLTALVQRHDREWLSADRNSTDELTTTVNLVASTSKYTISTPWLKIARVRIKDQNGNWFTIKQTTRKEASDDELITHDIGKYFLLGNYLYLVGIPQYSYTGGIEIQFQSKLVHFVPADTTKEVGFSPIFEELAALMPALDYLDMNGPDEQAVKVRERIGVEPRPGIVGTGLLNDMAISYQERSDEPKHITLASSDTALSLL